MLGLRFCAGAFSSCGKRGPLFIVVRGPLTVAASLVVEHRLQTRRLSSCGSRAQLLRGMWDLPRPGIELVSPALAGRFLTAAPPGKPRHRHLFLCPRAVGGPLGGHRSMGSPWDQVGGAGPSAVVLLHPFSQPPGGVGCLHLGSALFALSVRPGQRAPKFSTRRGKCIPSGPAWDRSTGFSTFEMSMYPPPRRPVETPVRLQRAQPDVAKETLVKGFLKAIVG